MSWARRLRACPMRSPEHPLTAYSSHPSYRARFVAVMLSLGMVALILATLIAMGALDNLAGGPAERLTAVRLSDRREPEQRRQKAAPRAAARTTAVAIAQPRPTPVPVAKPPPVTFIPMSKSDFAAADISKLAGAKTGSTAAGPGTGGAAYGPGEGPGGARLYNAEWYREPSHAEIAGYLAKGAPPGSWGMIACKTVENFHVEDCVQLGESPPGPACRARCAWPPGSSSSARPGSTASPRSAPGCASGSISPGRPIGCSTARAARMLAKRPCAPGLNPLRRQNGRLYIRTALSCRTFFCTSRLCPPSTSTRCAWTPG